MVFDNYFRGVILYLVVIAIGLPVVLANETQRNVFVDECVVAVTLAAMAVVDGSYTEVFDTLTISGHSLEGDEETCLIFF